MLVYFLSFLGGVALFLYGVDVMGNSLQKAAGAKMQRFLQVMTGNIFKGIGLGALATAMLQSSTITSVMTVGLVNAGLLTFEQSFGIIMGANIGTTLMAQIIAFNLQNYVAVVIFLGYLVQLLGKRSLTKNIGLVMLGFGFLMLGMYMMSDAVMPFRDYPIFKTIISQVSTHSLLGVLAGIVLTIIIQSSTAVVGILIAMAGQGLIPLEGAVPVLLGSNIGTCLTAVLASLNANTAAKRVAMAHVLFNVIGSVIFIILLDPYTQLLNYISGGGGITRQVANAHATFNILTTLFFIPIAKPFVSFIERLVPQKGDTISLRPEYLDDNMLATPSIALSLATKEVVRMGRVAQENMRVGMETLLTFDEERLKYVQEHEPVVDALEKDITSYLTRVAATNDLNEELANMQMGLIHACTDLERIGDHGETFAKKGRKLFEENVIFSDEAYGELKQLSEMVLQASNAALEALEKNDVQLAGEAIQLCRNVKAFQKEMRKNHVIRLNDGRCNAVNGFFMMELLVNMKRVSDHSKNIAQLVQGTF